MASPIAEVVAVPPMSAVRIRPAVRTRAVAPSIRSAATASLALESGGNLAAIATAAKNADIKVSAGPLTSESLASAVDFETAFPDLDLTGAVMVTFWTQGGAVCFSPDSGLDATGPQFPPGGIVLHLDADYAGSLYFIAKDSGALLNAIVSVPRNA